MTRFGGDCPLSPRGRTLNLLRTRLASIGITTSVRDTGYRIRPAQRDVLAVIAPGEQAVSRAFGRTGHGCARYRANPPRTHRR
ncbi:hypothetical protein EDD91_0124 [Streptomyces sp. KS 21]|nr:hypothetical protein EDD91_0124 [Streptomyces sp. KS 21]